MGRFPRVMPANAGIQDTTTLTEFRLLATLARRKPLRPPHRVPLDTRFPRQSGSPKLLSVSC